MIIDQVQHHLEVKQTLSDKEYRAYYENMEILFKVGMGAEAIKELLKQVDIDKRKLKI